MREIIRLRSHDRTCRYASGPTKLLSTYWTRLVSLLQALYEALLSENMPTRRPDRVVVWPVYAERQLVAGIQTPHDLPLPLVYIDEDR
jgi:hypothetical protein